MRKLEVIERYVNQETVFEVGQVLSEEEHNLDWLLSDAPGCFQEYESEKIEEKVIKDPAVNKMTQPQIDKAPSEHPQIEGDTDLTKIVGIGLTMKHRLNENGYHTIQDLIDASDYELLQIQYMTKSTLENIRMYEKLEG